MLQGTQAGAHSYACAYGLDGKEYGKQGAYDKHDACSVQLHFSGAKVLKNRYLAAGLFRSADETAALVDKFARKCRQKNPPGLSAGAEVKI